MVRSASLYFIWVASYSVWLVYDAIVRTEGVGTKAAHVSRENVNFTRTYITAAQVEHLQVGTVASQVHNGVIVDLFASLGYEVGQLWTAPRQSLHPWPSKGQSL